MPRTSQTSSRVDPVMPEAKVHLVSPKKPVIGRIVTNDLCMNGKSASFVRHTQIDVSGTALAGNFLVGQSFGVIAPGVDENGKPHKVRLYSISTPSWGDDGQGMVLATTTKRLIDEYRDEAPTKGGNAHPLFLGVCSNYMCDLRKGDEIMLSGPNGKRFLLPANPDEHDYLFIATGTGIAPFRGMLLELLDRPGGPCQSQIHLLVGTPYTTDLLYNDLFERYAAEHENLRYSTAISREPQSGATGGIYVDRALEDRLDVFGPLLENPRTLLYLCGLAGMQHGLFRALARHGLGEGYITIKDELADVSPDDWDRAEIKRFVRPTPSCLLEVY